MTAEFKIFAITFHRDEISYGTPTTYGRKPIRVVVGYPYDALPGLSWVVSSIDFDSELRAFVVSFEDKKIQIIPYSDDIEVIYYIPEADGGDIQDRD